MGQRLGLVTSVAMLVAVGVVAAHPSMGEAADMGGSKIMTLSVTKDFTASPWTKEVGYSQQAVGKLGFGLKNLLLGWTEFFTAPKAAADKGDNVFKGIGMGLKNGLEDTLGGVVHTVTFLVPQIDAPLPGGGVQFGN